jgi:protocatechuate 3,4-dioxygenase beta subunit
VTDADGRFTFDTIRPAPYPGRRTAAHVHLTIEGPGVPRRSAGVLFADDELVSTAERAASAKDGIFGDVRTVAMRDGVQEIDVNLRITAEGQYDA